MHEPLGSFRLAEEDLRHLGGEFSAGRACFVQSLPTSALAYLLRALWEAHHAPLVVVTATGKELDQLHGDLVTLGGGEEKHLSFFPALETSGGTPMRPHPDLSGDRLNTLLRCLSPEGPGLLVTCVQALLQKTPPPRRLQRMSRTLSLAQNVDLEELLQHLDRAGYRFEHEVQQKGEASHRGGIVDL
ncbi:MAG: hypothetical protein JXQ75_00080, partial [Phycisphaerae bacterium]|nr:hypothetical protein [Phycisphaerae bacterium]